MDMSALVAGGQALTALRQIAGALLDVHDFTKLATVQTELLQRILDVQGAMLETQVVVSSHLQTIDTLKDEIATLKKITAERESYALHEIRRGAFVYRRREGVGAPEPIHYLCQPCYDKGVKVVLVETVNGGERYQTCPTCRWHVHIR
jgi:hypothetical protein